ncbi:hypothetical protein SAMN02910298_02593 [Pseudobutyrivibrio sp. YE44]|uniref:hypothetical protein n=1 Tax=Pseudobutyrivibrio sp. YE44 TaxID=1520802 RepID=UPI000885D906|nr:hypothetical protein [Pseudobutyrivibrio sp. YE44]SDB50869.1 hypothetical protein SAMN02910298_02593 [Pseudobutyrivibrio sp. YE44]
MKSKILVMAALTMLLINGCSSNIYQAEEPEISEADETDNQAENMTKSVDDVNPNTDFLILDAVYCDNVSTTEDKFAPFFDIAYGKTGEVTSFADGYNTSSFEGEITIKRKTEESSHVKYIFYENNKMTFQTQNRNDMAWNGAEYIQFKDINGDGCEEILIAYYTRGTRIYSLIEFYIFEKENDKWKIMLNYDVNDETNVSKMLKDSGYSSEKLVDVRLEENYIEVSVLDGDEFIDGIYYPRGYQLKITDNTQVMD